MIVIPDAEAKAWALRENSPLEVHRVGSTSEDDAPEKILADQEKALRIFAKSWIENHEAYQELAKGPEGVGPYDPLPYSG